MLARCGPIGEQDATERSARESFISLLRHTMVLQWVYSDLPQQFGWCKPKWAQEGLLRPGGGGHWCVQEPVLELSLTRTDWPKDFEGGGGGWGPLGHFPPAQESKDGGGTGALGGLSEKAKQSLRLSPETGTLSLPQAVPSFTAPRSHTSSPRWSSVPQHQVRSTGVCTIAWPVDILGMFFTLTHWTRPQRTSLGAEGGNLTAPSPWGRMTQGRSRIQMGPTPPGKEE